jgi:hypothetical protein
LEIDEGIVAAIVATTCFETGDPLATEPKAQVTVTGLDPTALQLALEAAALNVAPAGRTSVAFTTDGVVTFAFETVSV